MFLLDTDISSYLMKRSHPALIDRVRGFEPRELKISTVSLFELEFGARRSGRQVALARVIRAFLENVEVLPFVLAAAREAAAVRAELTASGRILGAYDLQIAGHARALGAVLVTNNVREFERVAGLRVENWTREPTGG